MQSLNFTLQHRVREVWVTKALIFINCIVFIAMLVYGAGLWHSQNAVQLAWGANFGPATQDGQWWRLASAMFLHFGVLHLLLNMWALWDASQLVERMYGHVRFCFIYLASGVFGNLVSLVFQGNLAVSGGASGAIFGIYGALLIFLWCERTSLSLHEFRWLFWGALSFSIATIVFGFIVPGIDNAAHIGGLIAGLLVSIALFKPITAISLHKMTGLVSSLIFVFITTMLCLNIPQPKYLWSDELLLQSKINEFTNQEQSINRSWLEILHEKEQGSMSLNEIAGKVETTISKPYESSFDELSSLPQNPALPSSVKLDSLLIYTKQRKDESEALAEALRQQSSKNQTQHIPNVIR